MRLRAMMPWSLSWSIGSPVASSKVSGKKRYLLKYSSLSSSKGFVGGMFKGIWQKWSLERSLLANFCCSVCIVSWILDCVLWSRYIMTAFVKKGHQPPLMAKVSTYSKPNKHLCKVKEMWKYYTRVQKRAWFDIKFSSRKQLLFWN